MKHNININNNINLKWFGFLGGRGMMAAGVVRQASRKSRLKS